MSGRRSERGLALLAALLTVALLTVIVVEMTDATLVNTHLSRNAGNAVAAQLLARSAVIGGEALLVQDAQDPQGQTHTCSDGLWATAIPGLPVGSGTVALKITDEEGKLDLNAAGDKNIGPALRKLFQDLGLDPKLVGEIATWIGPPNRQAAGPEASDYCRLSVPCAPRHAPLKSVEELRLLRGFGDDAAIHALTPYVTAFGQPGSGSKVNVNTADPLVLKALGCNPRSDSRTGAGCATTPSQFAGCQQVPPGALETKSKTFAITAVGTVGDTTQTVRTIVQRAGNKTKRLTWNERPISDLSPSEVR